jgi:hypothetical protein
MGLDISSEINEPAKPNTGAEDQQVAQIQSGAALRQIGIHAQQAERDAGHHDDRQVGKARTARCASLRSISKTKRTLSNRSLNGGGAVVFKRPGGDTRRFPSVLDAHAFPRFDRPAQPLSGSPARRSPPAFSRPWQDAARLGRAHPGPVPAGAGGDPVRRLPSGHAGGAGAAPSARPCRGWVATPWCSSTATAGRRSPRCGAALCRRPPGRRRAACATGSISSVARTWGSSRTWRRGGPGCGSAPRGKRVLNLFSFTCAFSVAALAGGAHSVVNIDLSRPALALGRENQNANGFRRRPGALSARITCFAVGRSCTPWAVTI